MEWETASSISPSTATTGLRRRHHGQPDSFSNNGNQNQSDNSYNSKRLKKRVVRNLDIFPKIEHDLVVKSSMGNKFTAIAYSLTILIILAEIYSFNSANNQMREHATVDKSLNKKMRVDLNITFPALHCEDVHMDIMDVAGDAHNDVEDTMVKIRLHRDGSKLSNEEITVDVNKAYQKEKEILEAIDKTLDPNYCGPCYGAGEMDDCCNHCDDVLEKYEAKKWSTVQVKSHAEQCIREGKTKPKRMRLGEGCNIAGFMKFNRVNGNFHIAMGEGVERNGQHIHTFIPDDVSNFNSSHIIHELRFGPNYSNILPSKLSREQTTTLEGVQKILTEENGVSGMFQYFIKIVPTTYKGKKVVKRVSPDYDFNSDANEIPQLETNRYFTTERFTPLIMDIDDENWELAELVAKRNKKGRALESNPDGDDPNKENPGKRQRRPEQDDDDYYNFYYERERKPDEIAGAKVGGKSGSSHDQHEHHMKQQAILPGIFFIYNIYPFVVEISQDHVPFTHLFIRILSTVGGVFTIMGMVYTFLSSRNGNKTPRR